eukprot:6201985-Pleurochrysis_carterae.AAC.3
MVSSEVLQRTTSLGLQGISVACAAHSRAVRFSASLASTKVSLLWPQIKLFCLSMHSKRKERTHAIHNDETRGGCHPSNSWHAMGTPTTMRARTNCWLNN